MPLKQDGNDAGEYVMVLPPSQQLTTLHKQLTPAEQQNHETYGYFYRIVAKFRKRINKTERKSRGRAINHVMQHVITENRSSGDTTECPSGLFATWDAKTKTLVPLNDTASIMKILSTAIYEQLALQFRSSIDRSDRDSTSSVASPSPSTKRSKRLRVHIGVENDSEGSHHYYYTEKNATGGISGVIQNPDYEKGHDGYDSGGYEDDLGGSNLVNERYSDEQFIPRVRRPPQRLSSLEMRQQTHKKQSHGTNKKAQIASSATKFRAKRKSHPEADTADTSESRYGADLETYGESYEGKDEDEESIEWTVYRNPYGSLPWKSNLSAKQEKMDLAPGAATSQQDRDKILQEQEEENWQSMYQVLLQFVKVFGHCNVPPGWIGHTELADWVSRQRQTFRETTAFVSEVRSYEDSDSEITAEQKFAMSPTRTPYRAATVLEKERMQTLLQINFDWTYPGLLGSRTSSPEGGDTSTIRQNTIGDSVTAHFSIDAAGN